MLALRVEYLTGRCVATTYNDRASVEWPPHPARIYYALVAAWAEHDPGDDAEREALEWLEAQSAPALAVDVSPAGRTVVTHFVPVNDTAVLATRFPGADKLARLLEDEAACRHEIAVGTESRAMKQLHTRLGKLLGQIETASADLDARRRADQEMVTTVTADMSRRAVALLPERRGRQPRTFPSRALADPVMHVVWSETPPSQVRESLDAIARRVTHIGHSSSLVGCRVVNEAPPSTLLPVESGTHVLRVPISGLLDRLVEGHARHQQLEPRVMPCGFQQYAARLEENDATVPSPVFGNDWIVFRQTGGPKLSSRLSAEITSAIRAALMSYADQPVHEILSGHQHDGTPTSRPHAAFVALPFVGHPHASGAVLGLALVIPADADADGRRAVLRAVGHWEAASRERLQEPDLDAPPLELRLGSRGVLELERVVWGSAAQSTLRSSTWTEPSYRWVSVTPVALDRNPGDLRSHDPVVAAQAYLAASESVALGCERIGLPRPTRVDILPSVTMPGVSKAREFPAFPSDRRKPQRVKVHAVLEFDSPVRGPVLIGAGRYFGLGLFRSIDDNTRGSQP